MKISLNWLREFVDLKGIDPQEIGDKLTIHTAELEEIISVSNNFDKVVAGKLLETKPHPDSDKLSVAIFDLGQEGSKQIVYKSNTHKLNVGDVLPVAIDDAALASGMKIKNSEIRGQKSEGMIADNVELGMKNEGLMRFSDDDVGKTLPEICVEFGDKLFDIDNKSLTHRPDLMGHRGFAVELAAIFDRKLTLPEPVVAIPNDSKKVGIEIATDSCRRFCALRMEGVTVEPSDLKTQVRLENLGARAISNMVDITGILLQEFGQPLHVFDADKVEGNIIIRQAKKGEKIVALDKKTYELDETMIVIADEKKALSIAGIMGGLESGVTEKTTNIVLESTNFDPVSIRKTSQKLGLRSDASMRYEKSLDPENCRKAILLAAEMVEKICPKSEITSVLTDEYPTKFDQIIIDFDPQIVRKLSGINKQDLPDSLIAEKLKAVNFEIEEKSADLWFVKVPTNRATKDVSIAEDLVEEVIRLYGFENIKGHLPDLPIYPPRRNYLREMEWNMRDFLAGRKFLEVYNYSFASDFDGEFDPDKNYVEVANPLSGDQKFLRTNLIANFAKNCESELRTHGELQFFELGEVFEKKEENVLPNEKRHLALFFAKMGKDENEEFFRLKDELDTLLRSVSVEVEFTPSKTISNYSHPSKSADILVEGKVIGQIAVLHPQFNPAKKSYAIFAEINLEDVLNASQKEELLYKKISPFPAVNRDLSIVLNEIVLMADLEKEAFAVANNLQKVELFDEYRDNEKLGVNLKNLAFHLKFQSLENTLTEEQIDGDFEAIVKALDEKFDAKLRLEFDKARN